MLSQGEGSVNRSRPEPFSWGLRQEEGAVGSAAMDPQGGRPQAVPRAASAVSRRLLRTPAPGAAAAQRWAPVAVFLAIFVATVLFYSGSAVGDLATTCARACVRDFRLYVWSMGWLPHALGRLLNPFATQLLWAPGGTDLTWVTTLPFPALVALPVTLTAGPVASVNVLLLLAPPLAGWAAFLVCREVTSRPLPSFAGAIVFSFSTYVGQLMRAQLNLLLMFWVPLAVYLVLRYLDGHLPKRRFIGTLALVICGQFLTSTEVLAMAVFCCGLAWVVYYLAGSTATRARLREVLGNILLAGGGAAALLSPVLVRTLFYAPPVVLRPTEQNSADLLGVVVPGTSTAIGSSFFSGVSSRFLDPDNLAYVGIAYLLIAVLFAGSARRRSGTWQLLGLFTLHVVLAMGPRAHILGDRSVWMPGVVLNGLPLIQHAVPVRYVLFAWLALAVLVARWLAEPGRYRNFRYALTALAILSVLPSDASVRDVQPVYHRPVSVPLFFSEETYRRYLDESTIVMAVPHEVGEELLWQLETDMGFRLASAYIGPARPEDGLANLSQAEPPSKWNRFVRQLSVRKVDVIVAAWPLRAEWGPFLEEATGVRPMVIDGVALYMLR